MIGYQEEWLGDGKLEEEVDRLLRDSTTPDAIAKAVNQRFESNLSAADLSEALQTLLLWELRARLEREAPAHFEAPTGSMLPIDYEAEQGPTIAVRLQELFGLNTHPSIAKGAVPLVLELLSPAHRPVQVTRDLPGFWRGSYAAVRSDLRGRYPRHPWPEDPANALPTRRVKPRGT